MLKLLTQVLILLLLNITSNQLTSLSHCTEYNIVYCCPEHSDCGIVLSLSYSYYLIM